MTAPSGTNSPFAAASPVDRGITANPFPQAQPSATTVMHLIDDVREGVSVANDVPSAFRNAELMLEHLVGIRRAGIIVTILVVVAIVCSATGTVVVGATLPIK